MHKMDAPILEGGECSILIAEFTTGHIFKKDLTIYLCEENERDVFQVFKSFAAAKEYVINFIEGRPDFECSIFNHEGEHIKTFNHHSL